MSDEEHESEERRKPDAPQRLLVIERLITVIRELVLLLRMLP